MTNDYSTFTPYVKSQNKVTANMEIFKVISMANLQSALE